MFALLPTRRRLPGGTLLSLAMHAVAVAALLHGLRMHPVHVFTLPGTVTGTRVELAYLPGRAPTPTLHAQNAKPRPSADETDPAGPSAAHEVSPAPAVALATAPAAIVPPPTPHLTVTESSPTSETASPSSSNPDAMSGSDSWGSGSIQIALTTFSPSPKPDLSVLPHGVQGDVVVDVTIDPHGKVADLAVLHTLGYGIDSSVIGTLKTWLFRPATKDGAPIASVQELHFHFGPV